MAEIWGAVAVGIGAVGGAVISSQGAKKAGETAAAGSDAAIRESQRQFDTIRGDNLGRINIGNQAFNALGGMYGYSPTVGSPFQTGGQGGTPFEAQPYQDTGFFNTGAGKVLNPWSVTSKLGSAGKFLDPAGGLLGNLFGGAHGDEKRNLKAFTSENEIYDLGNGMLGLKDGTTFRQSQLQDVAGAWYGATYAPDGDQSGWQSKYGALIQKPQANVGQAGNGLTSDGVNQGMSGGGAAPMTAPDYSAFFKSPDYNFRKTEGMSGIGNAFSASGGAKSGNALKALAEFNSNLAAGEFGNYFNRQAAIAGIGQTSSNTSASAGISTGAQVGNALQNAGDARASGVAGQYNAIGSGISDLALGAGYWNANRKNPLGAQANNWGYGMPRGSYA